jgi:hypothetical protein
MSLGKVGRGVGGVAIAHVSTYKKNIQIKNEKSNGWDRPINNEIV